MSEGNCAPGSVGGSTTVSASPIPGKLSPTLSPQRCDRGEHRSAPNSPVVVGKPGPGTGNPDSASISHDEAGSDASRNPSLTSSELEGTAAHEDRAAQETDEVAPVSLKAPEQAMIRDSGNKLCVALEPGARVQVRLEDGSTSTGQLGRRHETGHWEGHWVVILEEEDEEDDIKTLIVRPENLELVGAGAAGMDIDVGGGDEGGVAAGMEFGARVILVGLCDGLNGQTGTVEEFQHNIQRWAVRLDSSGESIKVEAENLRKGGRPPPRSPTTLPRPTTMVRTQLQVTKGAPVVLQGLECRPEYNGMIGVVVAWDRSARENRTHNGGRWLVQIGKKQLQLQPANLRVLVGGA